MIVVLLNSLYENRMHLDKFQPDGNDNVDYAVQIAHIERHAYQYYDKYVDTLREDQYLQLVC